MFRCFSLLFLNKRVWIARNFSGISVKSLQLLAISFLARLLSVLRRPGYLPYDKTGDWFYPCVEGFSFILVCIAIRGTFNNSFAKKYDRFGNYIIPNFLGAVYILVPCVILAAKFHP